MNLPSGIGYDRMWYSVEGDTTAMNFKVQSCEEAKITVGRYLGMTSVNAYEVVLGAEGNSKSSIKKAETGEVLASANGQVLSKLKAE